MLDSPYKQVYNKAKIKQKSPEAAAKPPKKGKQIKFEKGKKNERVQTKED